MDNLPTIVHVVICSLFTCSCPCPDVGVDHELRTVSQMQGKDCGKISLSVANQGKDLLAL